MEVFTEFINYVAERGYIENSKNNKSYELIYIIRYLCDEASYKKMRRFFEGPEWVKEKDSGYALSADSRFKLKMSEFYPSICPF